MAYALFSKEEIIWRCEEYLKPLEESRKTWYEGYVKAYMEGETGFSVFKKGITRTREEAEEVIKNKLKTSDVFDTWADNFYYRTKHQTDSEVRARKLLKLAKACEKELFVDESYHFIFKEN